LVPVAGGLSELSLQMKILDPSAGSLHKVWHGWIVVVDLQKIGSFREAKM
jgi:hypothetical protein